MSSLWSCHPQVTELTFLRKVWAAKSFGSTGASGAKRMSCAVAQASFCEVEGVPNTSVWFSCTQRSFCTLCSRLKSWLELPAPCPPLRDGCSYPR